MLINEMFQDLAEKLFGRRFHHHRWVTTHTNVWQIPTRQECRCGRSRETEVRSPLEWRWLYSDGEAGLWCGIPGDTPVKDQGARP